VGGAVSSPHWPPGRSSWPPVPGHNPNRRGQNLEPPGRNPTAGAQPRRPAQASDVHRHV